MSSDFLDSESIDFLDLESSYFVDLESRDFVDAESPRFLDGESTEVRVIPTSVTVASARPGFDSMERSLRNAPTIIPSMPTSEATYKAMMSWCSRRRYTAGVYRGTTAALGVIGSLAGVAPTYLPTFAVILEVDREFFELEGALVEGELL